jgi:phosphoenolpyruvate phosphomutase
MVYMCFSTDILHAGHMAIIRKASSLGKLVVGVLSDEAVAGYKRLPMLPLESRLALFESIRFVSRVVVQEEAGYASVLDRLKPSIIVHGDDWRSGPLKPIRDELEGLLAGRACRLVEFPHSRDPGVELAEARVRATLATPDARRGRLRRALELKGLVTAVEAHSGITGLIAEKTVVWQGGKARQFDAMWVSSLCDSTAKGKPDIELVDMTSRLRTIDDIMEVTTKPVIFDGDTGGLAEHFAYTVRTLERMGVSMVIIEDKKGLKRNSLFGPEASQSQESVDEFCAKISAGKKAQRTREFMIVARIESLILDRGMEDALSRAHAYARAGADGIMIHSRRRDPCEIFEFMERFRRGDKSAPKVVVPTSFSSVTEEELKERGANIVIYANQLTRSGFPAMMRAAVSILENHRAEECDSSLMPIKEIITLIPEEA